METILIIDDNRQISDFLGGNVLPDLGYGVLVAYTGKQGLDLIKQHQRYIDLVLLDLQLPDISGLDLLRQLAGEGINLPTILFTGHGSEEVAVDAFRLGVQDYLHKPVDVDVLSKTIERALTTGRLRREKDKLTLQLKDQVEWLTALTQVSKSLTSSLDVDTVLKRIVEAGVYLTKAQEGFLALLDQSNGQLYLRATKNLDEDMIKTTRLPVTDSLVGMALKWGKPVRKTLDDVTRPVKVVTGFLVHSLLHVPIYSKGAPLGVLSVDNRTNARPFTPADETILTSLADYAVVALENAGLYEQVRSELHERARVEAALRESEERYALAVKGANDGLWDWDLRAQRVYYSPRWKSILGYSETEIGDSPDEWTKRICSEDSDAVMQALQGHLAGRTPFFEMEYRMQSAGQAHHWVLSRGLAVRDANGQVTRMAGSQSDIHTRKLGEQKLLYTATHDLLTGLANRATLIDRLKLSIERIHRNPDYLYAVLYLDLDRFKDINDSLGHATGDQLLIAIANKLQGMIRPTDLVARLGGDEFVILLDEIKDIIDATNVAGRIQQELSTIHLVASHSQRTTASIGIVLSTTGYERPDDVLRDADIAMYRAKGQGKSRYELFDPAMRHKLVARLNLETELRQALERNELRVYYQPVLSLAERKILSCEALARWQHPQRGLLNPKEFIPIAEETGLIIPLDRYVLVEACRQTRDWQLTIPGAEKLKVNVNLSGKHLSQPDLIGFIEQALSQTGLSADSLNLEITENVVMENFNSAASVMSYLQEMGVRIQVDDFGMGYSSLGYLSRFPLDALKIDQSFVANMQNDSSNMKIIQAIVMMTHGLGMKVTAEGVETPAQLQRLQAMGCENVQGYLIATPLASEQMRDLLLRVFRHE